MKRQTYYSSSHMQLQMQGGVFSHGQYGSSVFGLHSFEGLEPPLKRLPRGWPEEPESGNVNKNITIDEYN